MRQADIKLTCSTCDVQFDFTKDEQEFFLSKQLTNLPKRCPNCRLLHRIKRSGQSCPTYEVTCEECQVLTLVLFKPTGIRPVYCANCFHRQRTSTQSVESATPVCQELRLA